MKKHQPKQIQIFGVTVVFGLFGMRIYTSDETTFLIIRKYIRDEDLIKEYETEHL